MLQDSLVVINGFDAAPQSRQAESQFIAGSKFEFFFGQSRLQWFQCLFALSRRTQGSSQVIGCVEMFRMIVVDDVQVAD